MRNLMRKGVLASLLAATISAYPSVSQSEEARPPYQGPDAEACGITYASERWVGISERDRNTLVRNGVWIVNASELRCLQRRLADKLPLLAAVSDGKGIPGSRSVPWLAIQPSESTVIDANRLIQVLNDHDQGSVAVYCHHENCPLSLYALFSMSYGVPANRPLFRMYWFREGVKGWANSGGRIVDIPVYEKPTDGQYYQALVNSELSSLNKSTRKTLKEIAEWETRSEDWYDPLDHTVLDEIPGGEDLATLSYTGRNYSGPVTITAENCSIGLYTIGGKLVSSIKGETLGALTTGTTKSVSEDYFDRESIVSVGNNGKITFKFNSAETLDITDPEGFQTAFKNIRQFSLEYCS